MKAKCNFLFFFSLFFCVTLQSQTKIIDFDQAKLKNGVLMDRTYKWNTVATELSSKEIDGTPSLLLKHREQAPFAVAKSDQIEGGCMYLSFNFRRLDLANCDVIVSVNDKDVTTIDQTNGMVQSVVRLPVFISGPITFKFEQRGEKSGSIAIDNIMWTSCSPKDAEQYAKEHNLAKAPGNLLFLGDFETGLLDNYTLAGNQRNRIVKTPVRDGKYALRSVVDRYDDDVNFRCEIVAKEQNTRQNYMYQEIGKEYWYGFSVYIPTDFVIDSDPEMFAQFHGTPDVGESWRWPFAGLEIVENHYELRLRWDAHFITKDAKFDGEEYYSFGNVTSDKGKWTDWVFNVHWDYNKEGKGFMKIWKDGVLVFDHKGPNCFNDAVGPFLRFGLYRYTWKDSDPVKRPSNITNRVIYHDEYRIGNAQATYEEVAPERKSPTGAIKLMKKRE